MATWKVAPALAAGCAAILKPSELPSVTCLELAQICQEVGLPPVDKCDIGAETFPTDCLYWKLCNWEQDYDSCSSADQGIFEQLSPVSLELGGKSPIIVFEDVDLYKGQ
ncbi:hypothetical protein GYH30_046753 [Glycine max]|nr:hypothetical protein GYH30_046753 [Glycine max]